MATTFNNNWKNILDKLQNAFRNEFKGSMKVYRGALADAGNQYLQIDPLGSNLVEYNSTSEMREFSIGITYHFRDANRKESSLDHILRYVSRIESLVHDNFSMTLDDSTRAFNCRMETCNLNQGDENEYIVQWDFKCMHVCNIA